MYLSPWSSSSFPISFETGRGLTSISLPGLTIATPHNKLWLTLAFFLLKIFYFTKQDRSPQELKNSVRTVNTTSVCTERRLFPSNFRPKLGKQGKRSPCSPTSQNTKIPNRHKCYQNSRYSCSKSECNTTINKP